MTTVKHRMLSVLLGVGLLLALTLPVSAQELPTGAARIIEKVQTRIFISQASLLSDLAFLEEKAAALAGK
jgi:hypothetical protein